MKRLLLVAACMVTCSPSFAREHAATIDDNETVVAPVYSHIGSKIYAATVKASGTFGLGTISCTMSDDACVTHSDALRDGLGVAVTSTAADMFPVKLGNAGYKPLCICATMTGATNPNVAIRVYDNN